ncbi:MAG: hypothetical protein H6907_21350 [Hyphomicrobiales bacterium]|nr:hypothetical protein [Hyphomicrobiales bacterium]MCP5374290.1 hypothetical protein [Hyphomicrobiales bacterium]
MPIFKKPIDIKLFEELAHDNDRAVAIVGATIVEYSLGRAMLSHMVKLSNTAKDRVFKGRGPLASLSAKIEVSYCFGLIGPKTREDLNRIKDIRNQFAHSERAGLDFNDDVISGYCQSMFLIDNFGYPLHWPLPTDRTSPRSRFLHTISLVSSQLEGAVISTEMPTAIRT